MSGESLLIILIIGAIAGWLAGLAVRGTGFGLVADMCIGVVGALIGEWLLPRIGLEFGNHLAGAIFGATLGAIVLLLVAGMMRRGRRIRFT